MIQIYSPQNTNFDRNGDMVLFPSVCLAKSILGGTWYLDITHPIDNEERWKYIEKEAVLSVPTFMGKNQLYRIDQITDKTDIEISAKAYPIFFDSADDCFLMDVRPTRKTAQEALDIMTEGTVYSGESDITTIATAYFVRRNLMDAIAGDSPNLLEKWGGEVLYHNFKIMIKTQVGNDYGAEIRYGKNLIGVNAKEDMSRVVTRIVPVAYNGRTLSTHYVESPLIKKYAKVYTRAIEFADVKMEADLEENEDTTDLIICTSQEELDAALIEKCNQQFANGIDVYSLSITVDMVSLEQTEEYKNFKKLEKIALGDWVSCYNSKLGISAKARVVDIEWNCITDSSSQVNLGAYKSNFLENWDDVAKKIESNVENVLQDKINLETSARERAIKNLAESLAKSSGLFTTSEEQLDGSTIYYCHNKSTLGESDIVIKFTAEAVGISTDGGMTYPYGLDVSGVAVLERVYAVGINANYITTGAFTVKDTDGNTIFSADKDTGQVIISALTAFENKLGQYLRINPDDESISLGSTTSPIILKVINNRIAFTQSGEEIAWFSDNQLHTKQLIVTEVANLCGLIITKDDARDIFLS